MAGTSPTRRSSRARGTQSQIQHTSSSASSSSGRPERSSRAFVKTGSPQKSTGSGSLSSEPPEDSTATTTSTDDIGPLRRRSTRGKDEDRDKQPKTELLDMANISDENEIHEDDEAVRCVCGYEDYPGPPPLDEDSKNHALKDSIDLEPIFSVDVNDDLSGFFVQCDTCKVWEHGLCVGIVTEESSPDNYYCEICRRDLHKIYTASNSQKYSIYLPIHRPSRSTSRAASTATHGTRSPKGSDRKSSRSSAAAAAAAAAAQSSAKRRSTMNSRDAAYDEEEQLRRAIEASKEDTITEEPEPPSRRPKRGRDDEEEHPESIIKRQRTNSKSPTPLADQAPLASREDSDDDATMQNGLSRKSSARNTARTQRERTERDERREEQERKRAEAASKRKGRAERRRAEDSDPSEEMPLVTRTIVNRATESVQPPDPPASSQPAPDTPPASVSQPSTQNKKKPAPQPRKKGRNQYTRDRDAHEQDTSPARSMSRDISRNQDDNSTAHNSKSTPNEGGNKHHSSKTKGTMSSKVAMSDLKRRANNILEYITRTQVELANEPLSEKNSPQRTATDAVSGGAMPSIQPNGQEKCNGVPDEKATAKNGAPDALSTSADFKDLSCVEMMDYLTRDLVKWQHEYAS